MPQSPDAAIRDIDQGRVAPVYFLYGEERFLQREILDALERKLVAPDNREFNLEHFEARDTSVADWIGSSKTLSFFGGTKLVVVRDLHEKTLEPEEADRLVEYAQSPGPDACLVITAEKVDKKRKWVKSLVAIPGAVECAAPHEGALLPWLQKRARETGYQLAPEAARLMMERIGPRPGILARELDKVLTFAGANRNVTEEDVAGLVGEIRLENAFGLTDALKRKNPEQALKLLHNQLEHGEEPIRILGLIAWQFRVIWEVKFYHEQGLAAPRIAERMGAKPFMVEKALQYTRNFSREMLIRGFRNLGAADRELKSSGNDPEGILESLILQLCRSASGG
ncbi:MAG: DNA polymerase III subunit delta [Nitrospinae bacterium CG11_big_fil_rev_8_21_14_0_20_56_8]|nr:MAG: DNA polymerase III subunit delta [Nitrospinae bacterium CG11_big_fil_rev_8_21_14_0_20_56_8]